MKKSKTIIVAELSANHQSSIDVAKKTIQKAAECGVDAVKIQTFKPENITINSKDSKFLVTDGLWKGKYLIDLYKEAYTPWEWVPELQKVAYQNKIFLFSTPFDLEAVDFLDKLDIPIFKVASPEIIDLQLIKHIASKKKPMVISTGMAKDKDIKLALETCHRANNFDITLLHCVSGYPTPMSEMNVSQIIRLKKKFNCPVGLSDHSLNNFSSLCAVALGAVIIEKHFTILEKDESLDGSFSLNQNQLRSLVQDIRNIETCYGINDKEIVSSSEKKTIQYRRSLYFAGDLKKNTVLKENMIKSARPRLGMNPQMLDSILGKKINRDVIANEPVNISDLED